MTVNIPELTISTKTESKKIGKTLIHYYVTTVHDAMGSALWTESTQSEGWLAIHLATAEAFVNEQTRPAI